MIKRFLSTLLKVCATCVLPVNALRNARRCFHSAGLTLPTIPHKFKKRLKQHSEWKFSTRELIEPPYFLQHYIDEFKQGEVEDYMVLAHDGHGINSHALHYYRVEGDLGIFLQLGHGGVYMDNEQAVVKINEVFARVDELVRVFPALQTGEKRLIVGSDFYGCYQEGGSSDSARAETPLQLLDEVLSTVRNQ